MVIIQKLTSNRHRPKVGKDISTNVFKVIKKRMQTSFLLKIILVVIVQTS